MHTTRILVRFTLFLLGPLTCIRPLKNGRDKERFLTAAEEQALWKEHYHTTIKTWGKFDPSRVPTVNMRGHTYYMMRVTHNGDCGYECMVNILLPQILADFNNFQRTARRLADQLQQNMQHYGLATHLGYDEAKARQLVDGSLRLLDTLHQGRAHRRLTEQERKLLIRFFRHLVFSERDNPSSWATLGDKEKKGRYAQFLNCHSRNDWMSTGNILPLTAAFGWCYAALFENGPNTHVHTSTIEFSQNGLDQPHYYDVGTLPRGVPDMLLWHHDHIYFDLLLRKQPPISAP